MIVIWWTYINCIYSKRTGDSTPFQILAAVFMKFWYIFLTICLFLLYIDVCLLQNSWRKLGLLGQAMQEIVSFTVCHFSSMCLWICWSIQNILPQSLCEPHSQHERNSWQLRKMRYLSRWNGRTQCRHITHNDLLHEWHLVPQALLEKICLCFHGRVRLSIVWKFRWFPM